MFAFVLFGACVGVCCCDCGVAGLMLLLDVDVCCGVVLSCAVI